MQTENTQTPTRIERRKALNRQLIIESALDLFVEQGYAKTTVEDITSRADIGHGTFYTYFKSKIDLLTLLADDLFSKLDDYFYPKGKNLNVWLRIYNEAIGIMGFYVKHRTILLTLQEAMMVDKQFGEQWSKIHESLFRRVERDIKGSLDKGYCRDMDADAVILSLTSMLEGYGNHLMTQPSSSSADIEVAANTLSKITYYGVFSRIDQ